MGLTGLAICEGDFVVFRHPGMSKDTPTDSGYVFNLKYGRSSAPMSLVTSDGLIKCFASNWVIKHIPRMDIDMAVNIFHHVIRREM